MALIAQHLVCKHELQRTKYSQNYYLRVIIFHQKIYHTDAEFPAESPVDDFDTTSDPVEVSRLKFAAAQ